MPETRVLYIDDDDALARLVQKKLGRLGFVVEHASSPEQALTRLEEGGFDVLALDHYLGAGTGLEFLARLATRGAAPPAVYVTGSSEMSVAVAALKAGASDFVPKTIGDDFIALLASALDQAVAKARLVAEKEAAEAQVRAARDRAELLLAEVNHRVANSLAMVSSLVNLQANVLTDKGAKDALAETQARIFAIASVHKRLYTSGSVGIVELDGYLGGLLENLGGSMRGQGHGANLISDLAPLTLGIDATINLGVIVTELVTNAFKYAYPDKSGDVRVLLREDGPGRALLTVEDDGVGNAGNVIKGTGLGTRIIKAMARSIDADVAYQARDPGTAVVLSFALPQ
ncbi:histidine kinase dimerization/phosphoacceptor domain -containing protein [Mesorhizobium japonicum]|uniref:histidine kinase n=1 Tax=Mesorhizobium japonicum (strain LMG 29417 / CECT 9101 / MAFF 303099) TaxID=266835 RepID=Q98B42_RHILO|nr:histidine kinase dimerization/phosphoacceptor domain -containing protein [Mesorhizobium japonicum]BAB52130.1 two-component sensor protein [Mesorhizobium japonicum MAFF 303099]